ncbi:efflux transporter outer membrane subunit [Duganella sp. FT80W]|uniref:Efflux transporter outer membrane subunit n=1 Tax=Duganella guangzhouensis TaxID=2666084 RepID=A0A6I2L270_9BURK|nr:efflux transporter outer membrane subunit [Duganella guangzhouensis]MRW91337.1 efflux transporter outer membrane subunit [Duganella guangzhouensis]
MSARPHPASAGRLQPRPTLTTTLATLLIATLTGCTTLGPDFQPPTAQLPAAWPAQQSAAGAVDLLWWHSFGDPLLPSLIARATADNLDLQTATSRLEQARAARTSIAGAQQPELNATLDAARARNSQIGLLDPSGLNGTHPYTVGNAGLSASWELDLWGRVRRTVETADAQVEAAQEQRHAVLLAVAAETAHAYIQLRATQSLSALTQKNLDIARDSARLTALRRQEGVATELDVARAAAQVATIEARLPALAQREHQLISALGLLLAQPPQALSKELSKELTTSAGDASEAGDHALSTIPAGPQLTALGLPSELAQRRPDIRRASAVLHAATAGIGAAQADFYPRISLGASVGSQAMQLSELGSWDSRSFGIGPSISLPLFDRGRRAGTLALSAARQQEAALAYRKTVLTAWHEVDEAANAVRAQQQRQQGLTTATGQTRRALGYAQQQYQAGSVDFLNVLSAQDALLSTEAALTESRAAAALAQVDLYKALGGGWQEHGKLSP